MGAHEQTGLAACYLARRIRPRRHQEARAHAPRQGRRSHAAHAGARRADRSGVPDLPRVGRRRRRRGARDRGRAALRLRGARRRAAHGVAGRRRRSRRARRGVRADSRALHRRRPPPRGERGARARRDARSRGCRATSLGDGADASTFLAVAFPHDQMQILAVQPRREGPRRADARRRSWRAVRDAVRRSGRARRRRRARATSRCTSAARWQTLVPRVAPGRVRRRSASLDVSVLQDQLLAPVLKIADVRTDKRIDFVGGARGTADARAARRRGEGGGRLLAVPGQRRRPDGRLRRGRDHAAQEHLVRAEAAGRPADSRHLSLRDDGLESCGHDDRERRTRCPRPAGTTQS